jgi:hypothetical protein
MARYDENTVAGALVLFLDALAENTDGLLVEYVNNREQAIKCWFKRQERFDDSVSEEAIRLLVAGDFQAVKELLGPDDVEVQSGMSTARWITIWII